ncbi:hypothetical protein BDF22DRAFT_441022 [Syncephalis plumigaleata]|nr:hypothetical protein BDF22DRAFT_441022 [Syncephalis plumigaleata]
MKFSVIIATAVAVVAVASLVAVEASPVMFGASSAQDPQATIAIAIKNTQSAIQATEYQISNTQKQMDEFTVEINNLNRQLSQLKLQNDDHNRKIAIERITQDINFLSWQRSHSEIWNQQAKEKLPKLQKQLQDQLARQRSVQS